MQSLQDQYAPNNRCFGCGSKNDKGLRIKSFVQGDEVIATFSPQPHHLAFDGMLNGGICGALLDCHSNWTAAHYLMLKNKQSEPPCTVTAEFTVKLLKPTPMDKALNLKARVAKSSNKKAIVEAELLFDDKVTVTCSGVFVAVKEGHPAYHRW